MAQSTSTEVKVWDLFVRISHWTVAIAFFIAYLTEDEALTVHIWAGYLIGVLVILRVLWGFVGPQRARFSDFIYGPRTVVNYLVGLLRARAKRYLGHSPAGGAMAIALLIGLAATVGSGLVLYAEQEGAGPLAPFYAQQGAVQSGQSGTGEDDRNDQEGSERPGESSMERVHEVAANVTLALVFFHILGVLLASFVHHENLARSMITGRKRSALD